MITSPSLSTLIARNRGKPCVTPDCGRPRTHGTGSVYCFACRRRDRLYGDPLGGPLPVSLLRNEEEWIRRLLTLPENRDRAYLVDTVAAIKSCLDEAVFSLKRTKEQDLLVTQCVERGVDPLDIVIRVLAYRLWLHRNPGVVKSDKVITVALGRGWLQRRGSKPKKVPKKFARQGVSGVALQSLGKFAQEATAKLFANVIVAWEKSNCRKTPNVDNRPLYVPKRGPKRGTVAPKVTTKANTP
jgi:hypothetical protein